MLVWAEVLSMVPPSQGLVVERVSFQKWKCFRGFLLKSLKPFPLHTRQRQHQ